MFAFLAAATALLGTAGPGPASSRADQLLRAAEVLDLPGLYAELVISGAPRLVTGRRRRGRC